MIDRRDIVTLPSMRPVAVDIFAPSGSVTGHMIVFSHGANAAPDRYHALMAGWVAAGHVVIAPLHLDSEDHPDRETQDRAHILRTRIEDMAGTVRAIVEHRLRVPGQVARERVVAAGHSYGAYIAQIMAGATAIDPDRENCLSAPDAASIAAVIALSPPPVFDGFIPVGSWQNLGAPMLVQTGTTDIMPPFVVNWRQHLDSYHDVRSATAVAGIYDGVDHYFGGVIGRVDPAATPAMHAQLARFIRLCDLFIDTAMGPNPAFHDRPDFAASCDFLLVSPERCHARAFSSQVESPDDSENAA